MNYLYATELILVSCGAEENVIRVGQTDAVSTRDVLSCWSSKALYGTDDFRASQLDTHDVSDSLITRA